MPDFEVFEDSFDHIDIVDERDRNAPNKRIEVALDAGTIDRAIDRIDRWYSANPQRKDAPVLGGYGSKW